MYTHTHTHTHQCVPSARARRPAGSVRRVWGWRGAGDGWSGVRWRARSPIPERGWYGAEGEKTATTATSASSACRCTSSQNPLQLRHRKESAKECIRGFSEAVSPCSFSSRPIIQGLPFSPCIFHYIPHITCKTASRQVKVRSLDWPMMLQVIG